MSFVDEALTMESGPCLECGRHNPLDARFCAGCGRRRSPDEAPVDPERVADPLVGRVVADRYRILHLLGRGGMGVVYQAEHIHIGKRMALKLLHGELARNRDTVKRFQREAEAASQLNHPNTVQVFDFGSSEGLMYLVMELVDGHDLADIVRDEGPLQFTRVARICAQVCASLGEAHRRGIVHRDLKPENVMVTEVPGHGERAKVLDFGLAKLREGSANMTLTRAGSIVGTPYYMSPEQIRGDPVDGRGDVYSIGALIYKACTGDPPFVAGTPMGVLTKHLTDPVVPPSQRVKHPVPPELDRIVLRAMEKKADERYESADALRQDLMAYLASVGENVDSAAFRTAPDVGTSGVAQVEGSDLATKKEIERYERRLRRRGAIGWLVLFLLGSGLAASGVYAYQRFVPEEEALPTVESEPNGEPALADALPRGLLMRGLLGKRTNEHMSDADVYAIENPGGERAFIRLSVSAIPNMDIAVDLVKAGLREPVLTVDGAGVGGAEAVPSFPVRGHDYFVRVRERWITGQLATENVSDEYVVSWDYVTPAEDEEREVNDSLELAGTIAPGATLRGHIGWGGDVDAYCASGDGTGLVATLGGVPGVDLVLRVVDRVTARSTKIDAAGAGEGERTAELEVEGGRTCFFVEADDAEEGAARSNPDALYTLTLAAPGPPPEAP